MPRQLPADCLNEIFEYLEEDKVTLHSCLLVNRLWCQVTVRILWRDIWSFHYNVQQYRPYRTYVPLSIFNTLIACIPCESKKLLYKNGIVTSTLSRNPPFFNYASFCKVLSLYKIDKIIENVIQKNKPLVNLLYTKYLIMQEILKMFMIQISSLKILDYTFICFETIPNLPNIPFTYFPGAMDCIADLSELRCNSNNSSEFFYHLLQFCHNLKSLTIEFENVISNGLFDLITSQNNLKHLKLFQSCDGVNWTEIIPSLTKHLATLTKLHLVSFSEDVPTSFVSFFPNLRELNISFYEEKYFDDFKELQHVTFPKLQILKIPYACPKVEYFTKFLEKNGKTLKEFSTDIDSHSLKSYIAKLCP